MFNNACLKKRLQGPTLLSLWFPECFCFWAKSSSPPVTIRQTPKKLANSMFLHAVVSKLQCSITLGKIPAQSVTNFLRLCNRQDKLGIPAFLCFTFEFPECIFLHNPNTTCHSQRTTKHIPLRRTMPGQALKL